MHIAEDRIERRHRLLKDHGDVVAAHFSEVAVITAKKFLTVEYDRTGRMVCSRVGQQFEDRQRGNRFTGT